MKIIGINGSPRLKGNTAQLIQTVLKQAEASGATTKTYHLNRLNIKGCQGCYACRQVGREGQCALKDDMNQILEEILHADAVVLASPVYMWQMTAQAKLFTDRLMPLLKSDYTSRLNRQKLQLIFTQGNTDHSSFSSYFEYTQKMFSFLGFRVMPILVAGGFHQPNDINKHPELIQKARQAAEGLLMADCL